MQWWAMFFFIFIIYLSFKYSLTRYTGITKEWLRWLACERIWSGRVFFFFINLFILIMHNSSTYTFKSMGLISIKGHISFANYREFQKHKIRLRNYFLFYFSYFIYFIVCFALLLIICMAMWLIICNHIS